MHLQVVTNGKHWVRETFDCQLTVEDVQSSTRGEKKSFDYMLHNIPPGRQINVACVKQLHNHVFVAKRKESHESHIHAL